MTRLKKINADRKIRLTPIRSQVLELMVRLNKAVGAYDLLGELQKQKPGFKPITVYRALEFLVENHLIHRIESSNAYVICVHPGEQHQGQLLICDTCGHVAEVDAPVITKELNKKAEVAGFSRIRQIIEAHGLCKTCGDSA